jgi:hypothetical protein
MKLEEFYMTTVAEITAPSSLPAATKKGPGRPRTPATETPQQRIERLQAELTNAHEALKLVEQRREAIVGAVVVRHARAHEDFRRQLAVILRAGVKSKADLATIAELLIEP